MYLRTKLGPVPSTGDSHVPVTDPPGPDSFDDSLGVLQDSQGSLDPPHCLPNGPVQLGPSGCNLFCLEGMLKTREVESKNKIVDNQEPISILIESAPMSLKHLSSYHAIFTELAHAMANLVSKNVMFLCFSLSVCPLHFIFLRPKGYR